MDKNRYTDINSKTIDGWAKSGWEWAVPVSEQICADARNGSWDVLLTPQIPVPKEWFSPFLTEGRLDGVKILGLASGGGQQMPIFSLLGGECTVLDYSDEQLEREKTLAHREKYAIHIVKADMTKRLPFSDNSFDLIFHPVSNCYVENVYHVWNECFRVLKPGGVLLAGMDNGLNFLFEDGETDSDLNTAKTDAIQENDAAAAKTSKPVLIAKNKLPYNPLTLGAQEFERLAASDDGIQFSHTLEEQIGGQLSAGFMLTALYEDRDAEGASLLRDYAPQYIATRAVKPR